MLVTHVGGDLRSASPEFDRHPYQALHLTSIRFAMVFISASSIVVFSPSLLGFFEGIHKFRPILRPMEHHRCFYKLMQRGDVQLPQPILLFAQSWRWWHTSIMQHASVGSDARGNVVIVQGS